MDRRFFLAVAAGGAILFAWSFISWMVLPWHNATLKKFTSEETVSLALLDNAPNPSGGEAFLRFGTSGQGAEILRDHGFGTP